MGRGKYYGKIGVANLPNEVKKIWYSRNIEPDHVEMIDSYWPMETDPDVYIDRAIAKVEWVLND